jgi:hypothetical protein
MGQRLLAANVPASSRMWRAGIDDNEAILLGKGLVGAAVEVGLCGSRAVMNRYNDTGRRSKLLRYVDVETSFGRSSAKVGDLRQAAGCWRTLSKSGGGSDREVAREESKETHRVVSTDDLSTETWGLMVKEPSMSLSTYRRLVVLARLKGPTAR